MTDQVLAEEKVGRQAEKAGEPYSLSSSFSFSLSVVCVHLCGFVFVNFFLHSNLPDLIVWCAGREGESIGQDLLSQLDRQAGEGGGKWSGEKAWSLEER